MYLRASKAPPLKCVKVNAKVSVPFFTISPMAAFAFIINVHVFSYRTPSSMQDKGNLIVPMTSSFSASKTETTISSDGSVTGYINRLFH